MELKYEKEFNITTNQCDCYDKIKLSSLLDVCQVVASDHADILHVGFKDFIKNDLIWVIVRYRYEILKPLKDIKKLKVRTYALKQQLVEYPRDYEVYDGDELVVKGRSIWMIYDLKNKQIQAPNLEIYENDNKGVFLSRVKKLKKEEMLDEYFDREFKVTYSMIDHNMHLNNTHSLDLFYDCFKPKEDLIINSFQVEYVSQCYLDDVLRVFKFKRENKYYIYVFKEEELKIYYEIECNY